MDKLVASFTIPTSQFVTEIPTKDKLLDSLNSAKAIRLAILNDTIDYFTSLITNKQNVLNALDTLTDKLSKYSKGPKLSKCHEYIQALIVRQHVTSKFSNMDTIMRVIFPRVNWASQSHYTYIVKLNNMAKCNFNACLLFDDTSNTSVQYKPVLSRIGCPTFSSFVIKTMYYINMCMRLFDKVTVELMRETVKLADGIDVSNIDIKWKYTDIVTDEK